MGLLLEYFPITSLYALIIVGAVTASNITANYILYFMVHAQCSYYSWGSDCFEYYIANYILYSWCMLNSFTLILKIHYYLVVGMLLDI